MKAIACQNGESRRRRAARVTVLTLVLTALAALLPGCAGKKEEARVFQRGWVGGEYTQAHAAKLFSPGDTINTFPEPLRQTQKAGLLIVALSTNAPASLAGLQPGDLVVQLDHKPITRLQEFRRVVDRTEPGTYLPVTVYRHGEFVVRNVRVGRETFRKQGALGLGLITYNLNFGMNPGFSLFVLGYQPNPGHRTELGSVQQTFERSCRPGSEPVSERDWTAWALVLEISKGKLILSQEIVPPSTSPPIL
jgi:membrane-associated protease RseP (regulator of RpoE activity)